MRGHFGLTGQQNNTEQCSGVQYNLSQPKHNLFWVKDPGDGTGLVVAVGRQLLLLRELAVLCTGAGHRNILR